MFDQHVHSNYSIDSNEPMEEYIKNTDAKVITFTEHYDFNDPFNNFDTVSFDIEAQRREMNRLELQYGVKLLQGIEIGYSRKGKEDIRALLETYSFDVVLLSVHHNDVYDYMMDIPQDNLELVGEYFDLVIEALSQGYSTDILCHLDFGLRMRSVSAEDIMIYEDKIKTILNMVIQQDMSLEINSKGFNVYERDDLYDYFIDLYLELEGENIVVSSDAHKSEHYQYMFKTIYKFLEHKGLTTINYYQNRIKYSYTL